MHFYIRWVGVLSPYNAKSWARMGHKHTPKKHASLATGHPLDWPVFIRLNFTIIDCVRLESSICFNFQTVLNTCIPYLS